jgi:hypothetical protein
MTKDTEQALAKLDRDFNRSLTDIHESLLEKFRWLAKSVGQRTRADRQ